MAPADCGPGQRDDVSRALIDFGASCAVAPIATVPASSAAVHARPRTLRIESSLRFCHEENRGLFFARSVLVGIPTSQAKGAALQADA